MLDLSRVWPEWKAVEKLGEGSFGKVYRCEREEYGIKSVCAIKVISIPQSQAEIESMSFEGITADGARTYYSDVVNDFANEIKLMEMLKGAPNVVSVENYKIVERENEIGWDIYIRMEYLQSFVSYSKNKRFSEADVKKFALDIANALDVCSKSGVIHRDVKPDNIFVDKFGSFKLGDFGVARRLEGSMSMMSKKGTYSYMAPEVFKGEKYDNRADIYSLGMVMYKLLNRNRDPFIDLNAPVIGFKERNEAIERRRSGEKLPAPVDASPAMADVILKACEYRPEDRYSTVEEFKAALDAVPVIFEEPTVAARDFELPVPAPIEADYNDETVVVAPVLEEETELMGEEPTVMAGEEPTVMADDEATVMADPDATALADEAYDEEPTVTEEKEEVRKDNTNVIIALVALAVLTLCSVFAIFAKPDAGSQGNAPATETQKKEEFYYNGEKIAVGDYVTFGSYEQDNDTSNGKEDIEWLVLDKEGDRMLVISKYALDCQPYNQEWEDVTWETCTLRSWLNEEFIYEAFTSTKLSQIPTVTVTADANPNYDTDPGNDTQDKVFLLSIDEANEYFDSYEARECTPTEYATAQGVYVSDSTGYEGNCWWWLRSPGVYQYAAAYVYYDGDVGDYGSTVSSSINAVRPALWINL